MWIWMSVASALLLGAYDVAKKQALKRNGVLWVLLGATVLTALFMSPWLSAGPMEHHLMLMAKAVLVTLSWVSGLAALKHIPITIASPIKATRPVIVVLFSILLFGERLNLWQWAGVAIVIASMFMMSFSGKKEGIDFVRNKGVFFMLVSVLSGAASALYDKIVIARIEPLFVQSWTNVYISILLGLIILARWLLRPERHEKFRWDWMIVLIAVLITAADCLYFFAIRAEGSLLSVISLLRRGSVIVTFVLGAILFKEGNIRSKAVVLTVLLAGLVLLMYGSSIGGSKKEKIVAPDGYELVWNDEFDSSDAAVDSSKWKFVDWAPGRVNHELQRYVSDGVLDGVRTAWVEDGLLNISAVKHGEEVISARMNSAGEWKYGYFEARICLPKGKGTWPAFWMMPRDFHRRWPACGEIDIMEEVGCHPDYTSSSIHCKKYYHVIGTQKTKEIYTEGAEDGFHTYACEWTEDCLKFYTDGVEFFRFDNDGAGDDDTWPFNKPFYMTLNLAWGGDWGGMYGVDESALPCTMKVDYVRVFQKK